MTFPPAADRSPRRPEGSALAVLATARSLRRRLRDGAFDVRLSHRIPVVLVHGLPGGPSDFDVFRQRLESRGIRNVEAFTYRSTVDVPRLAHRLADLLEAVGRAAGSPHVDVIGHSFGGTIARHLAGSRRAALIRRLVTLGAPCSTRRMPPDELAIFGGADLLVPVPSPLVGRIRVVAECGHLGLLSHPAAVAAAVRHLLAPAVVTTSGVRSSAA
jgi:pimeloyl-ACP methyl ester carboxylesterase